MRITFVSRKFGNVERNSHCDVLHITPVRVANLVLDCNGDFAIKAYCRQVERIIFFLKCPCIMDMRIILVSIKYILYCIWQTIKKLLHTFIKIIISMQLSPKTEDSHLQHCKINNSCVGSTKMCEKTIDTVREHPTFGDDESRPWS